jgi:hypothetical protein
MRPLGTGQQVRIKVVEPQDGTLWIRRMQAKLGPGTEAPPGNLRHRLTTSMLNRSVRLFQRVANGCLLTVMDRALRETLKIAGQAQKRLAG